MNRKKPPEPAACPKSGFSLLYILTAVTILAFVFATSMSMIYGNRMKETKDKDITIARDFMIHYLELVKVLPFEDIAPNAAVSPAFNGENRTPNIRIPSHPAAISLVDADYHLFHPDLVWLEEQKPAMIVTLTINTEGEGEDQIIVSKHISMEVSWDGPLDDKSRQTLKMDVLRTNEK